MQTLNAPAFSDAKALDDEARTNCDPIQIRPLWLYSEKLWEVTATWGSLRTIGKHRDQDVAQFRAEKLMREKIRRRG